MYIEPPKKKGENNLNITKNLILIKKSDLNQ